jgi:3-oxoadipate enol-lactonase / 4-carboxymuconolactone decarboxylase
LWDQQALDLVPHLRILRYDARGHGASDAPPGEYSMERLGRDVLGLADALEIKRFAFCGISMGGFVGQWLGAHARGRVSHLILANTSPNTGPPSNWETRRHTVLSHGMHKLADLFLERSFSRETIARADPRVDSLRRTFLGTNPVGYAGCCSAIRDMNHTGLLREIQIPTLVIGGDKDVGTPWAGHGEVLARDIPDTRVVRLAAAHLSNIERPRSFAAAILDFLLPTTMEGSLEAGFQMRRSVLGDNYVDVAIAKATDFNREFQELITRFAWGTIWTRPGLDRRTRHLLVLATLAALGRWEEFRLHVRAGLTRELEACDVKEALLQTAIYAGVPAANTAFQVAKEEEQKSRAPV